MLVDKPEPDIRGGDFGVCITHIVNVFQSHMTSFASVSLVLFWVVFEFKGIQFKLVCLTALYLKFKAEME